MMSDSIATYYVIFFLHARNPASPSPKLHRHSETAWLRVPQ